MDFTSVQKRGHRPDAQILRQINRKRNESALIRTALYAFLFGACAGALITWIGMILVINGGM